MIFFVRHSVVYLSWKNNPRRRTLRLTSKPILRMAAPSYSRRIRELVHKSRSSPYRSIETCMNPRLYTCKASLLVFCGSSQVWKSEYQFQHSDPGSTAWHFETTNSGIKGPCLWNVSLLIGWFEGYLTPTIKPAEISKRSFYSFQHNYWFVE